MSNTILKGDGAMLGIVCFVLAVVAIWSSIVWFIRREEIRIRKWLSQPPRVIAKGRVVAIREGQRDRGIVHICLENRLPISCLGTAEQYNHLIGSELEIWGREGALTDINGIDSGLWTITSVQPLNA